MIFDDDAMISKRSQIQKGMSGMKHYLYNISERVVTVKEWRESE
jgi:hypothetical protein